MKSNFRFQFQSNMAIGSCAKETSTIAMKPKKNLKERKCWYKKNRIQIMDGRFSQNLIFWDFYLQDSVFPQIRKLTIFSFTDPCLYIQHQQSYPLCVAFCINVLLEKLFEVTQAVDKSRAAQERIWRINDITYPYIS